MAFSDLCHISNAFKAVENEPDQSERIMEENAMVRDLITKILDETGPAEGNGSAQTSEKPVSSLSSSSSQYPKNDSSNASFIPPSSYNTYQNNSLFNYSPNDQNGFNFNLQNGFGSPNGFVNYPDNDVNSLLGLDPITDTSTETVSPEQLNLLRLAAQEIGGAQFTSPNKYDDKFYNFFEPSQRNSLPDTNNMFSTNNFNRPNSLNLDMNFNSNYDNPFNVQRFPNKFENSYMKEQNQDSTDILAYLSQLNLSLDRNRDDVLPNNDYKFDMNGHYQTDEFNKMHDDRNKMFFNRNYPNKSFNGENNFYFNELSGDRSAMGQNFEFANQSTPAPASNSMNYKPNGFHPQNDFMQRRDINQILQRDNYQGNANMTEQRTNFDGGMGRDSTQQAALMRQNQELARQMGLLIRNRPPPNQLNVDVSFLHENTPYNLGLGALLGPSPPVPPPVLPSPMLDLPLLAPFYAMRNMRGAATSSGILHARLDACYEQWRQLERERKRTEARLALAYPGRAVSSSNSIPVPRLPPCPTRVDRLTVDMLREHTKVLTLMGKMETLRASVCVAQNKKPIKPEDGKITVLKRGQENIASEKGKEKDGGVDPSTFDPSMWRDDVKNLSEIAPHSEVESAMLAWRSAVAGVQAARRRELAPHATHSNHARYVRPDPILQLADAVKQLGVCARRARCAMWCDLTLTVALAPPHSPPAHAPPRPSRRTPRTPALVQGTYARCAMWCDLTLTVALAPPHSPPAHAPPRPSRRTPRTPALVQGTYARCAMWCDLTLTVALAPPHSPPAHAPPRPSRRTPRTPALVQGTYARCAMWCDLTLTVALAPPHSPPAHAPPRPSRRTPRTPALVQGTYARCAMWCDLTLTVALAPPHSPPAHAPPRPSRRTSRTPAPPQPPHSCKNPPQTPSQMLSPKQTVQESALHSNLSSSKQTVGEAKEEKATSETTTSSASKGDAKNENNNANKQTNKPTDKQQDKNQQRRTQNYRHKVNQGRNDFYQKNRYDNRFMHNRHPYHYLATGPIN